MDDDLLIEDQDCYFFVSANIISLIVTRAKMLFQLEKNHMVTRTTWHVEVMSHI